MTQTDEKPAIFIHHPPPAPQSTPPEILNQCAMDPPVSIFPLHFLYFPWAHLCAHLIGLTCMYRVSAVITSIQFQCHHRISSRPFSQSTQFPHVDAEISCLVWYGESGLNMNTIFLKVFSCICNCICVTLCHGHCHGIVKIKKI